jgi:hypothetical protein
VLSTFPQNPRSWVSRDKNYVGAVLESLQNKPIKGQRLLDIYFNNLLHVVCVERCPSATLARVLVRSTTTS